MGADKERIVVQELGTRRFVICVIETNERVAEERRELPACRLQLRLRAGCLDHFGDINMDLQLSMTVGIDSGRPFRFLALGEDGPG